MRFSNAPLSLVLNHWPCPQLAQVISISFNSLFIGLGGFGFGRAGVAEAMKTTLENRFNYGSITVS